MHDLLAQMETTRRLVSDRLVTVLEDSRSRLGHIGPETEDVTDAAAALLAGGKRLRASFCVAGWAACGGPPPSAATDAVIAAGASLELFQAAALVHDDVMDGSLTRRGLPAAHRRFAHVHRERSWIGPPDRFGEAAAILLGDLLLVTSFREIAAALATVPARAARRGQDVYDLMTAEVTLGQYLDMQAQAAPWTEDPALALDRAERVVRAKSARYSVEHPIVLGAALAGAGDEHLRACSRFGLPIGEAFQLRDDVLGVFGDPTVTGKPAGDDLREGKRTVLVALALESATPAQSSALRAALGQADLDEDALQRARDVLVATGALDAVERRIVDLADRGFAALDSAGFAPRAVFELRALARLAVDRQA